MPTNSPAIGNRLCNIGELIFVFKPSTAPLEFVFQEQSCSSLHSGRSLAWDHILSDIDDPCGIATGIVNIAENVSILRMSTFSISLRTISVHGWAISVHGAAI